MLRIQTAVALVPGPKLPRPGRLSHSSRHRGVDVECLDEAFPIPMIEAVPSRRVLQENVACRREVCGAGQVDISGWRSNISGETLGICKKGVVI